MICDGFIVVWVIGKLVVIELCFTAMAVFAYVLPIGTR